MDVRGIYHNSEQRLRLYRVIRKGDPEGEEELKKGLDGLQGSPRIKIDFARDLVELAKACCPDSVLCTVVEDFMKKLYEST